MWRGVSKGDKRDVRFGGGVWRVRRAGRIAIFPSDKGKHTNVFAPSAVFVDVAACCCLVCLFFLELLCLLKCQELYESSRRKPG